MPTPRPTPGRPDPRSRAVADRTEAMRQVHTARREAHAARSAGDAHAARGPAGDTRAPGGRRRASHSIEAILAAAIELLDEQGEQALTFRALAARLGGGVGSIYWYVASKDELLDRATDDVLRQLMERVGPEIARAQAAGDAEPLEPLRAMLTDFYGCLQQHPWVASYLMRNVRLQPHAISVYDLMGQQLMDLELTPRQRFHAVSALLSYVVGVGAEMGQAPEDLVPDDLDRTAFLADFANQWRALDADRFPFLHHVVDEFEHHQDAEQFVAGLDLLLTGIRAQAGV